MIVMTMQALMNDGDEVLIPMPDYPLWTAATNLAGGTAVHYRCNEEDNWHPDIEDIKSKITSKTKGIVVINPNNPTGTLYSDELLLQIIDVAKEHNLIIMADEIYDRILYDGHEHTPMSTLTEDVLVLSYNGLSKSHRIAGFRAGWMMVSGKKNHATDFIEQYVACGTSFSWCLLLTEAVDHFEAQANRDGLVEASGALRTIAVSLTKIDDDLHRSPPARTPVWERSASRPAARLVDHARQGQPGAARGHADGVRAGHRQRRDGRLGRSVRTFELNVAIPVMGTALLESTRLLANASRTLADKTIDGLEANIERVTELAGMSSSIVTPLNKLIGYEAAAKIAKHSVAKGITVREAVIDLGYVERGELTEAQLDEKLDLLSMTHAG